MSKSAFILVILAISGCASNIQLRQDTASGPDDSVGYLAGGFVNSYRESFLRMALEIHNVDTDEAILIELQQPKNAVSLELFPLAPGTYKISNIVEMGGIGDVGGRFSVAENDLSSPFNVDANSVTYIGHYDGKSSNKILSVTAIGSVGWVDTNSGYAFNMANRQLTDVKNLVTEHYPAFEKLNVVAAFDIASAEQEGSR